MRVLLAFTALLVLSACTTTSANIMGNSAVASFQSDKPPRTLALCLADHMTGSDVRSDGDHYWVVRSNSFGVIGRWDVYPANRGSRAEWRRVSDLTTGLGAGKSCGLS